MKLKISKLIIAAFLACLLISCSREPVVANVDGYKITSSNLAAAMTIEKEKYDTVLLKTSANASVFKRAVLESLVQEAILLNAAKNAGILVSDEELNKTLQNASNPAMFEKLPLSADVWKEKQRRRLIIGKLVKQEVTDKIPVSPDEIRSYYNSHRQEFYQPTQYHARQIVVNSKELANQIGARLGKGEDFAALAEEFSLSPDRKRGGDLGFFSASSFPPVFTEICNKLKIGERSGVVATDYGFQIFELLEKRQARQRTPEETADQIETILREKRMEDAFDTWFKELSGKAKVTIHERMLEDINV